MTNQEYLYTALRAMIIDANLGYDEDKILQGFRSNVDVGSGDDFVFFQELARRVTMIQPGRFEDGEITTVINLNEVSIQVDFFGNEASNACSVFFNYLCGFASNFLLESFPIISIGVLNDIQNKTTEWDRGKYLPRFLTRFSLFLKQETSREEPKFTQIVSQLKYYL